MKKKKRAHREVEGEDDAMAALAQADPTGESFVDSLMLTFRLDVPRDNA